MQTLEQLSTFCNKSFIRQFEKAPDFVAYAPGRINIIGEHTDYNQGLSMPCAINRWVIVSFSKRNDNKIYISSMNYDGEIIFELGKNYQPKNSWEKYIYGCILLFSSSYPISSGFQAVISGNVPIGSGVSSSAALEVAFMNALNQFSGANIHSLELIRLCQQVEHQYLNVKSGLLDQYASQFSMAGKVMVLDFQNLTHRFIPSDINGYSWVLCDTKVKRSLAASKYSERVEETKNALLTLQKKDSSVKEFRDIEEKHLMLITDPKHQKRIRHYVNENKRVLACVDALEKNDVMAFGKLITASHYSLKDNYSVSCEELDFLVEEALNSGYSIGSRMMGGGFGGCTINLIQNDDIVSFSNHIKHVYQERFRIKAEINSYQSVDGAGIIPILSYV